MVSTKLHSTPVRGSGGPEGKGSLTPVSTFRSPAVFFNPPARPAGDFEALLLCFCSPYEIVLTYMQAMDVDTEDSKTCWVCGNELTYRETGLSRQSRVCAKCKSTMTVAELKALYKGR